MVAARRSARFNRVVLVILLSIAVPLAAYRLVNTRYFIERINGAVSRRLGVNFSSRRIGFRLFPRLAITGGGITIEKRGRLLFTCPHVEISPHILSLLVGSFKIGSIHLESPTLVLKGREGGKPDIPKVLGALTELARGTELEVTVRHGTVRFNNQMQVLSIRAEAHIADERVGIKASCRSDVFDLLKLEANLDLRNRKGSSEICLKNGRLGESLDRMLRRHRLKIRGSVSLLKARLKSNHLDRFPESLSAQIEASLPKLTLCLSPGKPLLKLGLFLGSIQRGDGETIIHLDKVEILKPKVTLSGVVGLANNTPRITIRLAGTDANIGEIREVVLDVFGHNRKVRRVFNILKGGIAPSVIVKTMADRVDKLTDARNLTISGTIKNGEVFAPLVNLDLMDVSGKVLIALGILEGEIFQARTKDTLCKNGFLIIDLKKRTGTFYLGTSMETSLSGIPQILSRVTRNKKILRELSLVKELKGKAFGRLQIGGKTSNLNVYATVTRLGLTAGYQRIPYSLEISHGVLLFSRDYLYAGEVSGSVGKTSFTSLSALLRWSSSLQLWFNSGASSINIGEIFAWVKSSPAGMKLRSLRSMNGSVRVSSIRMNGDPTRPNKWKFNIQGVLDHISMDATFLPGTLKAYGGEFRATQGVLRFKDSSMLLTDSRMYGSGSIYGYLGRLEGIDMNLEGTMGSRGYRWIENICGIPEKLRPNTPVRVNRARIRWRSGRESRVYCNLGFEGGTRVVLKLSFSPTILDISEIRIADSSSRFRGSMSIDDKGCFVDFEGFVDGRTLDAILLKNTFLGGQIGGTFKAYISKSKWRRSFAEGYLQGSHLRGSWLLGKNDAFEIIGITLSGGPHKLRIITAEIALGNAVFVGCGDIEQSKKGCSFEFDLVTNRFQWSDLTSLIRLCKNKAGAGGMKIPFSFKGIIRLQAGHFELADLKWKPLIVDLTLDNEGFKALIRKASMCGILTQGYVRSSETGIAMNITASAKNSPLADLVSCLWGDKNLIDGTYSLKTRFISEGDLSKAHGFVEFEASKGRVYRLNLLSKIFALLNLTEILRGKLPDLSKEGFAYHRLLMEGPIKDGKFVIKKGIIDGSSMDIAWEGKYDIQKKTVDLTVLVAPFKTIDAIIRLIPVINRLLQGRLISIPVKVTGPVSDPTVIPLAPSAVGSEILGYVKQVLKLPFTILQPLPTDRY